MAETKNNIHKGHRNKIRESYMKNGFAALPEHNVLEHLLFYGIAIRDTNPVAHNLINKFGSFSDVLDAPAEDIFQVDHMTKKATSLLKLILPIGQRYKNILSNTQMMQTNEIIEYMKADFDLSLPKVYVLFFNFNHSLISCLTLSENDFDEIEFNYKDLALKAIQSKAASAIIVHTHCHSLAMPSKADVEATVSIFKLLKNIDIRLEDHIILSQDKHFSMANRYEYINIFNDL